MLTSLPQTPTKEMFRTTSCSSVMVGYGLFSNLAVPGPYRKQDRFSVVIVLFQRCSSDALVGKSARAESKVWMRGSFAETDLRKRGRIYRV